MIGGGVIHVCNVRKDFGNGPQAALSVWVAEPWSMSEAVVYVATTHPVSPGDRIWWQGRKAFWTPARGDRRDVPIDRLGFSEVRS